MAESPRRSASTDSMEALRARVAELEAENDALRAPSDAERTTKRSPGRAVLSGVLIIAGLLAGTAGLVSAFAEQQLLNTSNFVASFAPLADDPAVQQVVSDAVVTAINDAVDIPALTSDVIGGIRELDLPPRADAALSLLEAPAAQGLQGLIDSSVAAIVTSDAFATTWEQTLRISHTQIMATLHGDDDAALTISDGGLHLQIGPLVAEVKSRLLDSGITLADAIPAVDRSVVLVEDASLDQIATSATAVDLAGTWLPWASLALLASGVLAARRRHRAVIVTGFAAALLMGGIGIGISVAQSVLARAAARGDGVITGGALNSFFHATTDLLGQMALAIGTLAIAAAIIAWLVGPSPFARGIRSNAGDAARRARGYAEQRGIRTGRVGVWIDTHHQAVVIAIGVIAAALIVLLRPLSPAVIIWTTIAALAVVLVLQLLRSPDGGGSAPEPRTDPKAARHA